MSENEEGVWREWVAPPGEIYLEDSHERVLVLPGDKLLMVDRDGILVVIEHKPKVVH